MKYVNKNEINSIQHNKYYQDMCVILYFFWCGKKTNLQMIVMKIRLY